MVQSNDRVLVIKLARPRLSTAPSLQVCHQEEAQRGSKLLSCLFLKIKILQYEFGVPEFKHFLFLQLFVCD